MANSVALGPRLPTLSRISCPMSSLSAPSVCLERSQPPSIPLVMERLSPYVLFESLISRSQASWLVAFLSVLLLASLFMYDFVVFGNEIGWSCSHWFISSIGLHLSPLPSLFWGWPCAQPHPWCVSCFEHCQLSLVRHPGSINGLEGVDLSPDRELVEEVEQSCSPC